MEGVKNETRCQIIMNFYQKNESKGKPYTIKFFKQLDVTRKQIYHAIARVEWGESHLQKKGAGVPQKQPKPPQKIDSKIA